MRLRHPPGRSGRLWLRHRSEVASTGTDLLDKKRRALVQEYRRLQVLARKSQEAWTEAGSDAELWVGRLAVLAGDLAIAMLEATRPEAQVSVHWRSQMGVVFASEAAVDLGPAPMTTLTGSAAADVAVPASRKALQAAVDDAVMKSAFRRVGDELSLTSRRQRALQRRWLPALAAASARLDDTLDELEREEATRSLWNKRRQIRSA
jgi:vacuolar-type H+-ATPase subunit D/Vma8